jgi:hypothetical protein
VKTEGQIKQKVKQVIFRLRKAHIRKGLARHPQNCVHNDKIHLPVHTGNRATIRVCTWGIAHVKAPGQGHDGEEWNNRVCDASMGGEQQAAECPYFESCSTADELKAEFNENLGIEGGTPKDIGYIAKHYPDVAALLWVLGPSKGAKTAEPEEDEPNILAFFGNGEGVTEVPERPLVEEQGES